jgi:hypothetical protein
MALEGDVVPSRIRAPNTITEIAGFINLLGTLNQNAMLSQMLAGVLGVAGPTNAAGWVTPNPVHALRMMLNDRPDGPGQATLPTVVPLRSDFAYSWLTALKSLHDQGCFLPLLGGPNSLPTMVLDPTIPVDPMPYLGRVMILANSMALNNPATDPIVLARAAGSSDLFQVTANSIGTATTAVTPANYDVLQATSTGVQTVSLTGASLVYVNPILANAGFYPASPWPQPASASDTAWAKYTNISGLIPGQTRLGDDLSSLYTWTSIAASIFSSMTSFVWNGTAFAPS